MKDSNKPSHLRLHRAPVEDAPRPRRAPTLSEEVRECLAAFVSTTGWAIRAEENSRIAYPRRSDSDTSSPREKSNLNWQLVEDQPIDTILAEEDLHATPWVSKDDATKLLTKIERLVERLEIAEDTVRKQEAELAVGVGVSISSSQPDVADRLEDILESTAATLECNAAAFYLLDESTSKLKARAIHNLPTSRLTDDPRELRGALGDLEALMGNAVLLDDIALIPEWQSPEEFGSAICVPVGSPSMPHGTIWFWCEQPRKYTPRDAEVANMAANRIMLELERTIMGSEVASGRRVGKQIDAAGIAQASRLPDSQPLHKSLEIDGWSFQGDTLGGAFHDWDVTPKGQIVAAVGRSQTSGTEGAIVSSWLQSALRSNWFNAKNPKNGLSAINDQLWGVIDSDWTSALGWFQLNPETGYGSMCAAGDIQSFIVSERGYRPLGTQCPNIAEQPDPTFQLQRFILQPSEFLVAFTSTVAAELLFAEFKQNGNRSRKNTASGSVSQQTILDLIRDNRSDSASELAGRLARAIPADAMRNETGLDRSLIVLKNNRRKK